MIYTLTPNPAVDMNLTAKEILPDRVCRTSATVYAARGKGLNVSYVLTHFGVPSVVMGFFGGFTGRYITEECEKSGIAVKPTAIEGTNRINVFIGEGEHEYNIVNEGPEVSEKEKDALLEHIVNADDMTLLTVNGSLPRGPDASFYEEVAGVCEKKGVRIVWDISSPALKDLLRFRPYLIKPNETELHDIFGLSADSDAKALSSAKQLCAWGAETVLITLGDKGAYYYDGKNLFFAEALKVPMKSTVCAGDSFLAAFLAMISVFKKTPEEALRFATATAADVVQSDGIGTLSRVNEYAPRVSVKKFS